jgi:hypothetical protein
MRVFILGQRRDRNKEKVIDIYGDTVDSVHSRDSAVNATTNPLCSKCDYICYLIGILRNPDSDSKKIRTREKPGPGLEKNPDSCLKKPGLDF